LSYRKSSKENPDKINIVFSKNKSHPIRIILQLLQDIGVNILVLMLLELASKEIDDNYSENLDSIFKKTR
jgi:16S rRNA U1498 N3-methylase RsmE